MTRAGKYLAVTALGLSMCSGAWAAGTTDQNDPFEQTNRAVFDFNLRLDRNIAKPVAQAYVDYTPEFFRTGVHNFLRNVSKPVTLGNDLLQGNFTLAGQTLVRFVTNSTLGLAGLMDVASMADVPDHSNDFGITLGVWGTGEGAYLMLPLLGPSNPRDLTGKVADYFMDPLTYAHYNYENLANDLRMGFSILDIRAQALDGADQMERTSLDFYATTRSLYRQYRNAKVAGTDPDAPGDDIPPDDTPADDTPPTDAAPTPPPAATPAAAQVQTSGN